MYITYLAGAFKILLLLLLSLLFLLLFLLLLLLLLLLFLLLVVRRSFARCVLPLARRLEEVGGFSFQVDPLERRATEQRMAIVVRSSAIGGRRI